MTATPNTQILMARQPIFNTELKVVAYELLYRSDDSRELCDILNGDQATSNVLLNAYTCITDQHEQRQLPAFLNMTHELMASDALPSLSNQHLVVEVLEDIRIDQPLIDALQRFRAAGYRIALDDFVYNPEYDPLLEMAQIVKLDVLALGMAGTREQIRLLKPFRHLTLLAEKIESYSQLKECVDLGCKLFQGYFLCRPQLIEGRRLGSNEVILLQLMTALDDPNIEFRDIEALINHDPALTFRLLRIVNSAAFALPRKISSISDALILIGLQEIKKWVTLIALSGQQDKPCELTRQALVCARMCELVAHRSTAFQAHARAGFLTGLLSKLDAMLDIERRTLLEQISVNDEIRAALSDGEGPLATLLEQVDAFMSGTWDKLSGIDEQLFSRCYIESLAWCRETLELVAQSSATRPTDR